MKRLLSILCFFAEAAVFYLWQWQHIAAVGRVLIFYYWVITALIFVVGAFALVGALLLKKRGAFPTEGVIGRALSWGMLIARVVALVAVTHQFLATAYLFGYLLLRFATAIYRDLPESA